MNRRAHRGSAVLHATVAMPTRRPEHRTPPFINFDDMNGPATVDALGPSRNLSGDSFSHGRIERTRRSMDRTVDNQLILIRVRDSNAARLDRLHSHGVQLVVDGCDVLQFLFERVLATKTVSEFDRSWALNIEGLLDQVETSASTSDIATGRSLTNCTDELLTVSLP